MKVYIPLEGIGKLSEDKIHSRFLDRSFEVKIYDYNGKNWIFAVPKTQCQIFIKESKVIKKDNQLIVKLGKIAEGDNWFSLHKTRCVGEKDLDWSKRKEKVMYISYFIVFFYMVRLNDDLINKKDGTKSIKNAKLTESWLWEKLSMKFGWLSIHYHTLDWPFWLCFWPIILSSECLIKEPFWTVSHQSTVKIPFQTIFSIGPQWIRWYLAWSISRKIPRNAIAQCCRPLFFMITKNSLERNLSKFA